MQKNTDQQYLEDIESKIQALEENISVLQEIQDRLYKIISQSSEGIAVIDENGIMIEWNQSLEEITGITANEVVGQPYWHFQSLLLPEEQRTPEAIAQFMSAMENLLLSGEAPWLKEQLVHEYSHPDGSKRFVQGAVFPIKTDRGFMLGRTVRDISAQIETESALEESEQKYRFMAENISDVIWIFNLSREKFTYISPSVYKLRGFSVEEALNQGINESLTPQSAERVEKLISGRLERYLEDPNSPRSYLDVLQQPCKNGDVIWIETSTQFRYNQHRDIELIGVSRDITERKQVEEQMRNRAQELAALNQFSMKISRSLSIEHVTSQAVQGALEATQAKVAYLLLRDGEDLIPVHSVHSQDEQTVREFPAHKLSACLCSIAAVEQHAIFSADIHNDPRCTRDGSNKEGIKSIAALPLFRGDDVFGVLGLGSEEYRDFASQSEFLETLAGEVATGLQNALLFEAEAQRRVEAESLRQATIALTASLDLQHVLEGILDGLAAVVPYDSASVYMMEVDSQQIIAGRGYPHPEKLIGKAFPRDDVFTEQVTKDLQPIIMADVTQVPEFNSWGDVDYIRGWMVIPLVVRDELIGRLSIDSRLENHYDETHAELALAFANQAAVAIDNAHLFQQTQEHAKLLEDRVKERTAELQKVINLMAGREVRMAELKKVIKKLRAQIELAGMTPDADDPLLGSTR